MNHEPLSEKEKSIQRTKCPFGHLLTHQVCDCNIVQNKVSMCCGSKIDRPNSYYPICSECQAPIEKEGEEDLQPTYSNEPGPGIRPPVKESVIKEMIELIEEKNSLDSHSFSMEETLEIMGLKVRSDGNRLVVVDELGAETTGAEWKHDVDPKAGIVIEYLLQNHKSISAAILAERDSIRKILKDKKKPLWNENKDRYLENIARHNLIDEILQEIASLK